MRPLRLSMTAFGPYAGTEVVDFDDLTELGLFVVAGNNGSGKTTIFDALHYALYGTLPGRRRDYAALRSDHAPPKIECSVALDFRAHGADWRVERTPAQTRAKRRGTGTTEAAAEARLFRYEDGTPVAVTTRLDEVRAKCSELVGLSGKQFERVALLPQGEFSRVLQEGRDERRKLLRTLFSSEIFGDATTLLNEQAGAATANDQAKLDGLDNQQQSLAISLSELAGQSIASEVQPMRDAITTMRTTEVSSRRALVDELATNVERARQSHQEAADLCDRAARHAELADRLADHRASADQVERDRQRLAGARAAVPVVSNARSLHQHQRHLDQLAVRIDAISADARRALGAAGCDAAIDSASDATEALERLAVLERQFEARRIAASRRDDLDRATKQCHASVRRCANDAKTLVDERDLVASQLRQATARLDELDRAPDFATAEEHRRTAQATLQQRDELTAADSDHRQAVRQAVELDSKIETLEAQLDDARRAADKCVELEAKATDAVHALEAAVDRLEASKQCTQRMHQRTDLGKLLDQAERRADQLWQAFIGGTAARVAEALVDEAPCPVCGSCEHPEPATYDDDLAVVDQHDVAAARSEADNIRDQMRGVEAQIEALQAQVADVATRSVSELEADLATAKAMAIGARNAADQALRHKHQYEALQAQLEGLRPERTGLDADIRSLEQQRSWLTGALGEAGQIAVEDLQHELAEAEAACEHARHADRTRAELTQAIDQLQAQMETIEIGQLAADKRAALAADQLEQREHEFTVAASELQTIDDTLAASSPSGSVDSTDLEQRAAAARHAKQHCAELVAAAAGHAETLEAVRRAQSIFDERLAQSSFGDIDAARAAFVEPDLIDQIEAHVNQFDATTQRLTGQIEELGEIPATIPDVDALASELTAAIEQHRLAHHELVELTTAVDRIATELDAIDEHRTRLYNTDDRTRRLERVAALVKGDNDRNTSLENWVLAAHLRDVVDLANVRLARSTHQRFQLCVLDDGNNKRGKWGLDLGVEDTVTGTRRPTAGLSGGELFQASLALALGLADAVMNQSSGVNIDALFIDEGFGSLDETSVERAIDLLDELRDQGALVGVITHVPALLDALPIGIHVVDAADGSGSTITQRRLAA